MRPWRKRGGKEEGRDGRREEGGSEEQREGGWAVGGSLVFWCHQETIPILEETLACSSIDSGRRSGRFDAHVCPKE